MRNNKTLYERMLEILENPPLPQSPKEDKNSNNIAFPDSDATPEEIREYLNE